MPCRDPRWFQSVLNFLRDRHVPLPPCWHERQQLRQEALFYGLHVSLCWHTGVCGWGALGRLREYLQD